MKLLVNNRSVIECILVVSWLFISTPNSDARRATYSIYFPLEPKITMNTGLAKNVLIDGS